jgi:hypothetical protein
MRTQSADLDDATQIPTALLFHDPTAPIGDITTPAVASTFDRSVETPWRTPTPAGTRG